MVETASPESVSIHQKSLMNQMFHVTPCCKVSIPHAYLYIIAIKLVLPFPIERVESGAV